jgi:hypothetical protein
MFLSLLQITFIPVLLNIGTVYTVVFNTLFTLYIFETKMGSIFNFGPIFIFFHWSSDFCLKNGQRVSLLIYWLHSVDKSTGILGYC